METEIDNLITSERENIQCNLLGWFRKCRRSLPWRETYNPYHVWISEVLLQQTQMERGVRYFKRWIERFPTVESVAEADEQEILKYWEGLGYYARARNLHKAAQVIVGEYDGIIPCDVDSLLELPGIGPYTAAAVSSIACNNDVFLVDANVARIYSRIFDIGKQVKSGVGKRQVELISEMMLVSGKARLYNQALMDFGGMVCTPRNPHCEICPISSSCRAFIKGVVINRPVVPQKKKTIYIHMATGLLIHNGTIFIQQRKRDDIWAGLWEFPGGQIEGEESAKDTVVREYFEETGLPVAVTEKITTVKHSYMHYRVTLHGYFCKLVNDKKPELKAAERYEWVNDQDLKNYAFPAGHRKLLEYLHSYSPEKLSRLCSGGLERY